MTSVQSGSFSPTVPQFPAVARKLSMGFMAPLSGWIAGAALGLRFCFKTSPQGINMIQESDMY